MTNDNELAEKLRMLRNYGSKVKYHNEINGVNTRLDEVQAAVLKVGLRHLDETNAKRTELAGRYLGKIKNTMIKLPNTNGNSTNVYHLFPIMVEDRDGFTKYLKDNGIGYQIHYPTPPFVAECYSDFNYSVDAFPDASYIAEHEVSLPLYTGMKCEEIDYVIDVVNHY